MLRPFLYRIGRRLYMDARGDLPNQPGSNGEYWLLSIVMNYITNGAVLMDIGANKGDWTERALRNADARGLKVKIKAFEPSSPTRKLLCERFKDQPSVDIYDTAVSNNVGSATFYANSAGSGTNSLNSASGNQQETVEVTTIDQFMVQNNIGHVSFIKIDVEGFDALALEGAKKSLEDGVIDLIQFEYNWRWILNQQSLKNIFKMIENLPYIFGKLAGNKILLFDQWHFEMDRFFENNYVLIRKQCPFASLGIKAHYDSCNTLTY